MEIDSVKKKKTNLFTIIPLILVGAFFAFQLIVLSNVGDKGEKITTLKRQQETLKVENEIYRAKIMELQTSQSVVVPLTDVVKIERKNVNIIDMASATVK